ncbi:hypothetical protein IWQ62_005754, partial [Dispira parvispora]
MFGVLMAGMTYVAVDSMYPVERIQHILDDCGCRFVIWAAPGQTHQNLVDLDLPLVQGMIDVDEAIHSNNVKAQNPFVTVSPALDDLAYIVYTSGSTGKPKGVKIRHCGLANLVRSPPHNLGIQPGERVLQVLSLAFDGCVNDIYSTLCNGGTLVLCTNVVEELAQVDVAAMTPSMLSALNPSAYPNLRRIITAAEPLPQRLAQKWGALYPLYNAYGPSECTVCTHVDRVQPQQPITIGTPIAGSVCRVLDSHLRPVPVGVPGELYIGGYCLSAGYVNRPDLDEIHFVPDPGDSTQRLYRTGDMARWLSDGRLEYLSREGDFVKLRGYRVEIGEIETVLSKDSVVTGCAVVIYQEHVYAFVTPDTVDDTLVLAQAQAVLPHYMVPKALFPLNTLPLTANGKVDKKKLHDQVQDRLQQVPTSSNPVVKPQTLKQGLIVDSLVQTLFLASDRVGIHDSFFQLGGDSISAIRLSANLRERGLTVSVANIFDHPTAYTLAEVATEVTPVDPEEAARTQAPVVGTVPLTPIQHWFFDLQLETVHRFNQSFMLEMKPSQPAQMIISAIQQLITHHDMLRGRFVNDENMDTWCQSVAPFQSGSNSSLLHTEVVADPMGITALRRHCVALSECLSITTGPLVAVGIYRGQQGEQLVYWTVHHLVVDLVSWRIMLEDLANLLIGKSLPAKTVSYQTWAHHLLEQAPLLNKSDQEELNQGPVKPSPKLYVDFDSPLSLNTIGSKVTATRLATKTVTSQILGASETGGLRAKPLELLLAGFTWAYLTTTGESNVTVDLESHGR